MVRPPRPSGAPGTASTTTRRAASASAPSGNGTAPSTEEPRGAFLPEPKQSASPEKLRREDRQAGGDDEECGAGEDDEGHPDRQHGPADHQHHDLARGGERAHAWGAVGDARRTLGSLIHDDQSQETL